MNNIPAQYIEEDEIDLRELFNTILRRKKLIIIMTLIITLLASVYAFMKTPIYVVKSNIEIGHIGEKMIADPASLNKRLNIVFNVEDVIDTKEKFVSKVSSIALNKKVKNFITVTTEAISNDEALKKHKEVLLYIQQAYKAKIDNFIFNNNNSIRATTSQIQNLEKLEKPNLQREIKLLKTQKIVKIDDKIKRLKNQDIKKIQRQIKLLKTQEIVKIDDKIRFYNEVKLSTLNEKIKLHQDKLKTYIASVNSIYKNTKDTTDTTALTVSSLQMVNYQNLILNSQNKIEDLKVEIAIIKNETIPNLEKEKSNILNVTIKDLEFQVADIKNITIKDLQRAKQNLLYDTLRKLEYKLAVTLPNKKIKLQEKIKVLEFNNSDLFCQNSKVVGKYVMHDYASKPKKKLIIIVAFITGLILSIFLVFFLEFLAPKREEETKQ